MPRNGPDRTAERHGGELVDSDITRVIIGAFYTVYNALGFGFLESVYSRALYIELRKRGLRVEREVETVVSYEGHPVGRYRIDLLVEGRIVIEIKSTKLLAPEHRRQLLNCVRCSDMQVGLLLHFGPEPKFYRVISESRSK
jgi:GxxExxY protein